jgi:pyridoxine 5-phosphate synthase
MRLAVNIDHIATVREARKAREPEPVAAALLAELAGAAGITVHLRGDRRHINERDVELLRQVVATKLNIEMAATVEMAAIARRIGPDQVTLVAERPHEVTTAGGLDVVQNRDAVAAMTRDLRSSGIRVSVFIDPEAEQIAASADAGADAIEINTGQYADARAGDRAARLAAIADAARQAGGRRLEVLAGHGLTYFNVRPVVVIPQIVELNIGHSIVARAVLVGLDRAVRDMVALLA